MTVNYAKLRPQVLDWLSEQVPDARVQHILRVEQMAIALAKQHRENVEKAALAGLMHDLAKYYKPKRLLEMAIAANLPLDPVDQLDPHLLHADVSAIVAQQEFGISDVDVLEAIANHTLGQPGMSHLSCIVYLADSLEPERGDTPDLNQLRMLSQHSLAEATWKTCDYSVHYLLKKHRLIHPRTLLTRNWFLQTVRQSGSANAPYTLPAQRHDEPYTP